MNKIVLAIIAISFGLYLMMYTLKEWSKQSREEENNKNYYNGNNSIQNHSDLPKGRNSKS